MVRYLTEQEVIAINQFLIQKYSSDEPVGVKEPGLLNSAVNRPKAAFGGEDAYPTVAGKAAALFESLSQNHCFYNANKRTAFVSLQQFLRYNGYRFVMDQEQAVEFTVDLVLKKYTFEGLERVITDHLE